MAVRLAALLPRAVIVALVWILGTAAFTLAADNTIVGPSTPNPSAGAAAAQTELVVPSVSGQAYVFAKGILEDSGFAWRVVGSVRGYSSNRVITQSPAAGTRVVDTGAPTVIVRLVRGPYDQLGRPVDVSPYRGTAIRLAGLAAVTKPAVTPKHKPAPKPKAKRNAEACREAEGHCQAEGQGSAAPARVHARRRAQGAARRDGAAGPRARAPALGRQPPEDRRERAPLALPARLDRHRRAVRLVARSRGASDPVAVDQQVERQWGIGGKSQAVAKAALAQVRRKSK